MPMPNKTPKFWYRDNDSSIPLIEKILWPFSIIYGAGHRLNLSNQIPVRLSIPVVCVGNIVAGGGGKTPTLLALIKLISTHKLANVPVILSRGYGGSKEGPHTVNLAEDTAACIGDEPLLLAKTCKTIISKNRAKGAVEAQNQGGDLILMDDGYQNQTVPKDIALLVIDGASGFGNNKLLPSGPLREPVEDGLARADAVIILGDDARNTKAKIPSHIPMFMADIKPLFTGDRNANYIAFCGLARPEKFKKTLDDLKLNITAFYDFADHHNFTSTELQKLQDEAKLKNSILLTTEKDFVRIPPEFRDKIQTLPIEIIFQDEEALLDFLKRKLGR
jgi:tetraacyldisaccharide 4'-kinase